MLLIFGSFQDGVGGTAQTPPLRFQPPPKDREIVIDVGREKLTVIDEP